VPAGHWIHDDAPANEKLPLGQEEHEVAKAPEENVPAAHGVQVDVLLGEYSPGVHCMQPSG